MPDHSGITPNADACCQSVTTFGFRPRSRLLMYCWLKPESSANGSWVKPSFCLIRFDVPPDQLAHVDARQVNGLRAVSSPTTACNAIRMASHRKVI
jgi:hypothetical protein